MPPLEECLSHPAVTLWGVRSPSERGGIGEYPMAVVDVLGVEYRLFRHPKLYNNVRVSRFVADFWNRRNTTQPKDPELCTGWELDAQRIYFAAYEAAQQQREKRDGRNN